MSLRTLAGLLAVAVAAVFLLPSTMAIYAAVNGTAWDLTDLTDLPRIELHTAAAMLTVAAPAAGLAFAALTPAVTHPLSDHVPLFELDCALIR